MALSVQSVGFVYILHFEFTLGDHARHYCGCTLDLKRRVTQHARGLGANLTRVARERHIRFKLAAVGVCPREEMRLWELRLKQWHGSREQCGLCCTDPRAITGTTPYPLERIQWPLWSDELEAQWNAEQFEGIFTNRPETDQ